MPAQLLHPYLTPAPHPPNPSRAHGAGFRTLLLYEPAGCLQQPHRLRQLELQLLLQRLTGAVHLQVGWQAQRQRGPGGGGSPGGEPGSDGLTAVLLAAADGEWPLLAAAAAAAGAEPGAAASGQQQQQHQASSAAAAAGVAADGDEEARRAADIDAAIAAPGRLKRRLQAAAGPLAGCEPDFVLVRGWRVAVG